MFLKFPQRKTINTCLECLTSLFQHYGRYIGQLIDESCELVFKLTSSTKYPVIVRATATAALSKIFVGVPDHVQAKKVALINLLFQRMKITFKLHFSYTSIAL